MFPHSYLGGDAFNNRAIEQVSVRHDARNVVHVHHPEHVWTVPPPASRRATLRFYMRNLQYLLLADFVDKALLLLDPLVDNVDACRHNTPVINRLKLNRPFAGPFLPRATLGWANAAQPRVTHSASKAFGHDSS